MAKKVFLGVGHGGIDSGAVGYIVEKDVNLNVAKACRDYLVARGVEVKMSREKDENDDLNEECRECNAYKPDLAVDIHTNSGGGDGWEAWYSINGGTGKTLAQNIEAEVKKIGQNSRGCKTRKGSNGDYYGFIRMTNCPAVITEGAFVDNRVDAAQIDELSEQKAFGEAYARGILKTLGIEDKPTPKPTPTPSTSSVKVGDLVSIKSGSKYATVDKTVPSWAISEKWFVDKVNGDKALLGQNEKKNNNLTSWLYTKDLTVVGSTPSTFKSYVVRIKVLQLNVRKGAGTEYPIVTVVKKGDAYTIVEEKKNGSSVWGKLKSGAGWICLDKSYVERV